MAEYQKDERLTDYQNELKKWDLPRSQGGYRPDTHEEYPMMLYRARRNESGTVICDGTTACQKIVMSEADERLAHGQGWITGSPVDAIQAFHDADQVVAVAAAEVAYDAQRMTKKAKREFEALEAATDKHIVR